MEPLLLEQPGGALIFDADGTLWAHDVGSAVFNEACREAAFSAQAGEALREELSLAGISYPSQAGPVKLGELLLEAYFRRAISEKRVAEIQVWIYAGLTEAELRSLTQRALKRQLHSAGIFPGVRALIEHARTLGATLGIVSASPRLVVEEASRELGFESEMVAGGIPCKLGDRIAPGMAEPLPYGPVKATVGRRLVGSKAWVATFGDSGFDLDMMRAAQLAVGIGEKPGLLAGLKQIPHSVRFSGPDLP